MSWAPAVSFYFKIEFSLTMGMADLAFQEISGLSVSMQVEEVEEGGESRFKHQLPKRRSHSNLVCKRALSPLLESPLSIWIKTIMEGDFTLPIVPVEAMVSLLNADGDKVASWYLSNVYPVKWELSAMESKKNELVIETIEFAYNTLTRIL